MFKRSQKSTLATLVALSCAVSINAHTTQVDNSKTAATEVQSQPKTAQKQIDLPKVSEAFGHFIGRNLKTPGVNFDLEAVIKGMRDGAAGKTAPMSDKEYEQMMAAIQENAFNVLAEENLKAAKEYLDKNKKESGIVAIEDGKLLYKIEKQGSGDVVTAHSSPQINYTGQFIDGTVFNSSSEAGGPVTIPLDQTIKGFNAGITGMKEGEKRKLYIHPDLGYGTSGHFPPNSLLIFDIEVIKANSDEQSLNTDDDEDEFSHFSLADDDADEENTN
jgi:peptidylprolyl isomerase